MPRAKILIDCDPGHDDAVAILYAAKHLDLVGITTCHGNNTLDNVTRNALQVLTLAGLDVPLAKGCADPLAGARAEPPNAHGKTGLDGADLPEPDRTGVGQRTPVGGMAAGARTLVGDRGIGDPHDQPGHRPVGSDRDPQSDGHPRARSADHDHLGHDGTRGQHLDRHVPAVPGLRAQSDGERRSVKGCARFWASSRLCMLPRSTTSWSVASPSYSAGMPV